MQYNVPVVPIAEVGDFPDDPQVKAAGIISPPADPSVPAQWVINHPMHIDGMPTAGIRHAPEVGEHTADVLSELGYDTAAIAAAFRPGRDSGRVQLRFRTRRHLRCRARVRRRAPIRICLW